MSFSNTRPTFAEQRIAIAPMQCKADQKIQTGAVLNTEAADVNVPSVSGASYFVISMDSTPSHIKAFQMEMENGAEEFLTRHVSCYNSSPIDG